jgi:hypothetical protein
MKRIVLILLMATALKAYPQSSCSPTLKEIFDFNVGDEFNYEKELWDAMYGIDDHFLNFKITNKEIKGDTIIYKFDGEMPASIITLSGYNPFSYNNKTITDSIMLIDSSSNYLNLCKDSLIEIGKIMDNDTITIYSKIGINEFYSKPSKYLGNYFFNITSYDVDNLYIYSNDQLERYDGGDYTEIYSVGLGLIYQYHFHFESSTTLVLASYIKGGGTTKMFSSTNFPLQTNNIKLFPNPARNRLSIKGGDGVKVNSLTIIDNLGRVVLATSANQTTDIDISNLACGIYFVEINTKKGTVWKKILKE